MQRRSIRRQLTRLLVATTMVALMLAGVTLLAFELRKELQSIEQDLVAQADILGLASEAALAFNDRKVGAQTLNSLRAKENVVAAALYDESGQLFATYVPASEVSTAPPERVPPAGYQIGLRHAAVLRPVVTNDEVAGFIFIRSRHEIGTQILHDALGLAAVLAASLALALLLSNRLQKSLTGPLSDVAGVAQRVLREGAFELRANKTSDDEIGDLVDAFNAMLQELGRRARVLEESNHALRRSEDRYQLAVRGSSAGLWDWDLVGGSLYFSPRFKELLGYSDQEFPDLPDSIRRILHAEDRAAVRAALSAHLAHDHPYQVECRLRDKQGRWRWFFVAGMVQRDAAGKPQRMAGSVVEVTERKQAELVLQDANRAKDEFLATLAHELRNPLAPIRTGLAVLQHTMPTEPVTVRTLATMERQLKHMVRLIDDLLDISRISRGQLGLEISRTRLRGIVDAALELTRPVIDAGNHQLSLDLPADEVELMGDATRLAQALGNLLGNAAKYTPSGGHLGLSARRIDGELVIEVSDDGIGIPAARLDDIFQLFTQIGHQADRSQGGLGIGLYLVRRLAELHGGSVSAASAGPGKGSTFRFSVPCLPAVDATAPRIHDSTGVPQALPRLRVLVVDDNQDAADTLATVLGLLDLEATAAYDSREVLAKAEAWRPDIALLDLGMPGIDGLELARQLRAHPRLGHLYLVAVTGWGSDADRKKAMAAGFDHHLTKPIDVAAVQTLIHDRFKEQTADSTVSPG